MNADLTPVPGDPDATLVGEWLSAHSDWIMTAAGDHMTAAVMVPRADEPDDYLVAMEWPGRRNKTDEQILVKLLMSPEDALVLSADLAHTARFLMERRRASGFGGGKSVS